MHLAHALDILSNEGLVGKQISGKFPVSLFRHLHHLSYTEWLLSDAEIVCYQILHTNWLSDKLRVSDFLVQPYSFPQRVSFEHP